MKLKLAKESTTEVLLEMSEIALFAIELLIELSRLIAKILGCFTAPWTNIYFFSLKLRLLPIENWELFTLLELGQGELVLLLQAITIACSSFLNIFFGLESFSGFSGVLNTDGLV